MSMQRGHETEHHHEAVIAWGMDNYVKIWTTRGEQEPLSSGVFSTPLARFGV